MHAQHAENPAARPAHRGNFGDRLVEYAGVEFVAAVALRLQGAQQPVILEIGKGLVGQAAQFLASPRPLGQRRQQPTHAPQIVFRCHARLVMSNQPCGTEGRMDRPARARLEARIGSLARRTVATSTASPISRQPRALATPTRDGSTRRFRSSAPMWVDGLRVHVDIRPGPRQSLLCISGRCAPRFVGYGAGRGHVASPIPVMRIR